MDSPFKSQGLCRRPKQEWSKAKEGLAKGKKCLVFNIWIGPSCLYIFMFLFQNSKKKILFLCITQRPVISQKKLFQEIVKGVSKIHFALKNNKVLFHIFIKLLLESCPFIPDIFIYFFQFGYFCWNLNISWIYSESILLTYSYPKTPIPRLLKPVGVKKPWQNVKF